MRTKNKMLRLCLDQKLMVGIRKHFGKGTLVIDGQKVSGSEMLRVLAGRVDAREKSEAAKAQWQRALSEEHAAFAETDLLVSRFRQALLLMFASSNDVLADFGLAPRRSRRELTVVEKVERVAKAQATREKRHTIGKRAKAKIKATDPVTVIVAPPMGGNGTQPAPQAGS
jgi:hypothetical protein